MSLPDITVVNKHHKQDGIYIGRGSPLGNPYRLSDGEPRGATLVRYSRYLHVKIREQDPAICNELNRLAQLAMKGPLKLQCFCAPHPCHGDVVKDVLLAALNQPTE